MKSAKKGGGKGGSGGWEGREGWARGQVGLGLMSAVYYYR